MKTSATAKFVGTSARKTGLVAALIRGRRAMEAQTILAHTKDHPNRDGSTPTAWIKLLWEDLKGRGYTDRPWDHHVYKAARDFLSGMGWLVWQSPTAEMTTSRQRNNPDTQGAFRVTENLPVTTGVPEPSSLALLSLGLGAFAGKRLWRRGR